MEKHRVVSRDEWLAPRLKLLEAEKERGADLKLALIKLQRL